MNSKKLCSGNFLKKKLVKERTPLIIIKKIKK
jgi:hypothetical protein